MIKVEDLKPGMHIVVNTKGTEKEIFDVYPVTSTGVYRIDFIDGTYTFLSDDDMVCRV